MRVFLEEVDGHVQGACFPFRAGFASGNVGLEMAPSGAMFVGGTNRGWGSVGNRPFAIERLDWTGKVPFEIKAMRLKPDGFELEFTQPVDPASASNAKRYKLQTYTYEYRSQYGSPEVDHTQPVVIEARPSNDQMKVRLVIDSIERGHVHELVCDELTSRSGAKLLHPQAYYTASYLPSSK